MGDEGESRSTTLNGVQHDLTLQVTGEDVFVFGTEGLLITTVLLEGDLLRTPKETELSLSQFLKYGVFETSVLLNTEFGTEEHRFLCGVVRSCIKYGHSFLDRAGFTIRFII